MSDLTITSLQNPRVKETVRLRDRRERDRQQRILIDGARELLRAVEAGIRLQELFVCEELCHTPEARQLFHRAADTGADVLHVTPRVFEKLAFGDRAEGLLGVAERPQTRLADWQPPSNALVAVLEGVEKPGNVGAVLRSADAAGISGVIVAGGGTDLYNPNAIRASLGTVFTQPVFAVEVPEAMAWLRKHGVRIFAAIVGATQSYTAADYTGPTALVLGGEAAGVSDVWRENDITPIALPMLGAADSLNVSVTAAVLFYEALRQRQGASRSDNPR